MWVMAKKWMTYAEEFTYLGAIVDKAGGGSRNITNRLQKAYEAFQRLTRVWAARGIE